MPNFDIHIGEMLARNARMFPDDTALVEVHPEENYRHEFSWKQFEASANRFANVLRAKGIGKGDKVVHLMMNFIDWLIAYFGIIRTGAWAVPLNFRFTAEDVQYAIDAAGPNLVLFGEEFTDRMEKIHHRLAVESYVFSGERPPVFAESFQELMADAPSVPLEVENFIHNHPDVKDTAVFGFPDERLGEIVAVVIEAVQGTQMDEAKLLDFCQALPRYKRPRKIFFGEIPRNPTG